MSSAAARRECLVKDIKLRAAALSAASNPNPVPMQRPSIPLEEFIPRCCQIQHENGSWQPFDIWPAQRAMAREVPAHPLIAWLKARQLGATWFALAHALKTLLDNPGVTVLLFSRRKEEAWEMLHRLKGMYRRLPPDYQLHGTTDGNAHYWPLGNGARALAFPSRGGDSYSARLAIVDEVDLVPDLNGLLASVKPTIDAGGQLILLGRSNKAEPQSPFKKLWRSAQEGSGPWKALFQPWHARPGRDTNWYESQRLDSLQRTGGLDALWEQYPETPEQALCAATLTKRFPLEWVEACFESMPLVRPGPELPAGLPGLSVWELPRPGVTYVIGADPAQGIPNRDASVACVLERERCRQVAELAGAFEPTVFAIYLGQLARYYGNAGTLVGRLNHGHAVLAALKGGQIRLLPGHDGQVGWNEVPSSICQMWDAIAERLRVGDVRIRSRVACTQLIGIEGATLEAPPGECFLPGTLILTKQGLPKPIEEIQYNDVVMTHLGRPQPVDRIIQREYVGDVVQIKVSGLPDVIIVTPEHPLWCKRRSNSTHEFRRSHNRSTAPVSEWVLAKDITAGDWLAIPKRLGLSKTGLSHDQLYSIGFWLAEGSLLRDWLGDPRGISITNTEPAYLERVLPVFLQWFHDDRVKRGGGHVWRWQHQPAKMKSRVRMRPGKRHKKAIFECDLHSRSAADYFAGRFCDAVGGGLRGVSKRLPSEIFNTSGLLPIVTGFADGDGSQRKNQQHDVNIYTASKQLAWQLRQIMIDNGVWCTIRKSVRTGVQVQWVLNVKESYLHRLTTGKVVVPLYRKFMRHVLEDNEYFYTPVRGIKYSLYSGLVYNLSVDLDNSYIAGGIAAHNCDDHADAFAFAVQAAKTPTVPYAEMIAQLRGGKK